MLVFQHQAAAIAPPLDLTRPSARNCKGTMEAMTQAKPLSELSRQFVSHFGEMGSRWGINRTVGQIYALLFLSSEPLNADQIADTLEKCGFMAYEHCGYDFDFAIRRAYELAREGGSVLLSPACASFDMFSDYESRGREFKRIVKDLELV